MYNFNWLGQKRLFIDLCMQIRQTITTKKKKPEDAETFQEIDYVNPDGTVVPKLGVGGWNSYPWTCSECSAIYFEIDELREHISTSHNISSVRYLCLDCPKVYSKYVSFVSHVKHHRPFLKYCCNICYKWYSTSKEVEDHQITHNEEYPYHCNICDKRFRVQSLLNLHTRSHLPSDVKNCFPCNHCPKKFGELVTKKVITGNCKYCEFQALNQT